MLAPGLEAGPEPVLRVLALDVPTSDFSTRPFHELWLFARCLREGREAWYALSHLVGPDGDVVFGRETFGYPSRMAAIEWSRDGNSFAIAASRLGRRVAELGVAASGGVAQEDWSPAVEIVGLRLHPPYRAMTENGFVEPGPRADLVAQPWTFDLSPARSYEAGRLELDLPADPGPGNIGKPDPWYELAGAEVVKVVTGRGTLRRGPGVTLGKLENYWPYYAERFDGTLDASKAISGEARHTFLVG
jgi:hypothetical protein